MYTCNIYMYMCVYTCVMRYGYDCFLAETVTKYGTKFLHTETKFHTYWMYYVRIHTLKAIFTRKHSLHFDYLLCGDVSCHDPPKLFNMLQVRCLLPIDCKMIMLLPVTMLGSRCESQNKPNSISFPLVRSYGGESRMDRECGFTLSHWDQLPTPWLLNISSFTLLNFPG